MKDKNANSPGNFRNYPGRGAIKCAVCGEPVVKHEKMELCKGRKPK